MFWFLSFYEFEVGDEDYILLLAAQEVRCRTKNKSFSWCHSSKIFCRVGHFDDYEDELLLHHYIKRSFCTAPIDVVRLSDGLYSAGLTAIVLPSIMARSSDWIAANA